MVRSINEEWLLKLLITDIIFAIILFLAGNLNLAILGFIGLFVVAIGWLYHARCPHCGHLGALKKSNTSRISSNSHTDYFSRREPVGHSEHTDEYGNYAGRTVHYQDRRYSQTIIVGIYEDTFICKYCGIVSKRQYHKEDSRESHPID